MREIREMVVLGIALVGFLVIFGLAGESRDLTAVEEQSNEEVSKKIRTDTWTQGVAVGVMGSTTDGTAFATNLYADRFLDENISVGPLLQLGFTNDMTQVGFSGQLKQWLDLSETQNRGRFVLQEGLGFVHSDNGGSDTSWLVPLGVSYDYDLNPQRALTATVMVNITDLETKKGDADVMPGFVIGLRF